MKILIAPRARQDIVNQLGFLIDRNATAAARRLERRLTDFIGTTIARFPRSGKFVDHRDLWESWVPQTRFVIWYRFSATEVQIVRVWHASQDRQSS